MAVFDRGGGCNEGGDFEMSGSFEMQMVPLNCESCRIYFAGPNVRKRGDKL